MESGKKIDDATVGTGELSDEQLDRVSGGVTRLKVSAQRTIGTGSALQAPVPDDGVPVPDDGLLSPIPDDG